MLIFAKKYFKVKAIFDYLIIITVIIILIINY